MAELSEVGRRFAAVTQAFKREDGVQVGTGKKGFGASALTVGDRIFALVSARDEFVVKLPRARVEELVAAAAGHRWDPGHGRVMKEWLAVDPRASLDWVALAREAREYVAGAR